MSGGPFRELFVACEEAILEAARQRNEAQNRINSVVRANALHVNLEWAAQYFCKEYGFSHLGTLRESDSNTTVVRVRMKCGHAGYIFLDETAIVRMSTHEIGDYICRQFEKPPTRKCTCIEYIPIPPCTPGVCK